MDESYLHVLYAVCTLCTLHVMLLVCQAKASGKKPQKVALKVSPQGILLYDSLTNKLLENVSIYRCVCRGQHNLHFSDRLQSEVGFLKLLTC